MKTGQISLLLMFAIFFTGSVRAQSSGLFFGAKAGLGIPNLTAGSKTTPLNDGYSSRLGFYGGILAEYQTSKRFSIHGEINFSSQGGKRNGMQALPLISQLGQLWESLPNFGIQHDNYMYANVKNEARLNYVEVPLMAKVAFGLSPKLNFYLEAGPYLGLLLHAENVTRGSSPIYVDKDGVYSVDAILLQAQLPAIGVQSFNHSEDITSDINKVNLGGQGAVGFELLMGTARLRIEGGGNYGFIPIQKDDVNGTNHTGAGTLTLVYLFKLK
jgi:hypothetical protein